MELVEARDVRHVIVHREEHGYCAHAHAAVAADGTWLVVFNHAPRRAFVLHPPEEPLFRNMMIRSADQGATWSAPQVVPDYRFSGTECAGLTPLSNGTVLLSQWRFAWYPLDLARRMPDQTGLSYPDEFMRGWMASPEHEASAFRNVDPAVLAPWVRGPGETWVHRSDDFGASFSETILIDTAPFSGGYAMRSGVELLDGTVLLLMSDIPHYRQIFAIRSADCGRTWSAASLVAALDGHEFEEPALVRTASGRLVAVLRENVSRRLHQVKSDDGGATWSRPHKLDISGYPAHLALLDDGRLLMTCGWRQPDYGIRAVFSSDDGGSWNIDQTIRIRGGLPNRNLGYPATIRADDGTFHTVYYGEDGAGLTCIMATSWRLP